MYLDQYNSLIELAQRRSWPTSKKFIAPVYTEVHHIIPRCMGGTNNLSNLVRLTGQEHFNAHLLLWKAYPSVPSLALAAYRVSHINGIEIDDETYNTLRQDHAAAISIKLSGITRSVETRHKISKAKLLYNGFKGMRHTDETKAIISNSVSGDNNGMFGRKHTKEVCDNLSRIHSGKTLSDNHKAKLRASHIGGLQHTDITKDKMKVAWENRESVICPHCGIVSKNSGNMNRWHFNNCRKKI